MKAYGRILQKVFVKETEYEMAKKAAVRKGEIRMVAFSVWKMS